MMDAIGTEIDRFRTLLAALSESPKSALRPTYRVEEVAPDAFVVRPTTELTRSRPFAETQKTIDLTFGALVHGNEWGGLWPLNMLLHSLLQGLIKPEISLGFFLGNPEAALQNQRFIDRDLNRSFSVAARPRRPQLSEDIRASQLESILGESRFFIDFHQTIQPCLTPFFIFGYRLASLELARALSPYLPVITHWGQSFSKEGSCSDEYVNARGGLGITIELGATSPTHDPLQASLGFQVATAAVAFATEDVFTTPQAERSRPLMPKIHQLGPLYTWGYSMPWPEGTYVELIPGITNFSDMEKDQIVGYVDGTPIRLPVGGKVLFPKYLTAKQQKVPTMRPTELLRILRPCSTGELPTEKTERD